MHTIPLPPSPLPGYYHTIKMEVVKEIDLVYNSRESVKVVLLPE